MALIPAPRLTPDESPHTIQLARIANEWFHHHDNCSQCGPQDWYEPGAPRPGTLTSCDPSVLCPVGQRLFNEWCRLATLYAIHMFERPTPLVHLDNEMRELPA